MALAWLSYRSKNKDKSLSGNTYDMIRQIAAATLQSAQMLREFNTIIFNTPAVSIAGSWHQDVDEVIADHIQQQDEEQRRLNDERLRAMIAQLEREWFGDNYLLIMLDCSRLMDRYRLSQLGLEILHDRYHHNSHYNTYSWR